MAKVEYTALEKLYGLKLFQKVINKLDIPEVCRNNAIKYADELKVTD